MLPLAAVLAILAMGQTLVIQQGGIDLSVPGMVSLTHRDGHALSQRRHRQARAAILLAFAATIAAGRSQGYRQRLG